jgi:hypothetical protein
MSSLATMLVDGSRKGGDGPATHTAPGNVLIGYDRLLR